MAGIFLKNNNFRKILFKTYKKIPVGFLYISNMKKIFILVFSLAFFLNCKAQTITMTTNNYWDIVPENGYYKDSNNSLNTYIGEWKYENVTTSTSLIIKLRKVTNTFTFGFYQDLLIGEIHYIKNGVEKINTLNQFNVNITNQAEHNLVSRRLVSKTEKRNPEWNSCDECISSTPLVEFIFRNPNTGLQGTILIGVYDFDSIRANFYSNGMKSTMSDPNNIDTLQMEQVELTVPNETFTLEKQ
jgi:hypothetical protein